MSTGSGYFCWVGQYLRMMPGQKSPRQNLALKLRYVEVPAADQGPAMNDDKPKELRLGKSLRQQMMGYLTEKDWVRIVGKAKVDGSSGEVTWKAYEVVKLSTIQIDQVKKIIKTEAKQIADTHSDNGKSSQKPVRVLVCQKSSCRKKGGAAVMDAIASAFKSAQPGTPIKVQAVGCLKNCKAGPNMVILPKASVKDAGLKSRYERIKPKQAQKVVERLISAGG